MRIFLTRVVSEVSDTVHPECLHAPARCSPRTWLQASTAVDAASAQQTANLQSAVKSDPLTRCIGGYPESILKFTSLVIVIVVYFLL